MTQGDDSRGQFFLVALKFSPATIPKFIAGKNQRQLFLRCIAKNDGTFKVSKVVNYFFFTIPFASASLAASK